MSNAEVGILGKGKGKNGVFPQFEFGSVYQYDIPEPEAENSAPWQQDPAVPPDSIRPRIISIVASMSISRVLDLEKIAEKGINLHYHPGLPTPLVLRLRNPVATVRLFKTGRMVISGPRSVHGCGVAAGCVVRKIQKMGMRASVSRLEVHHITATCNLGFRVRLPYLGRDKLMPRIRYKPEKRSWVSIPLSDPKAMVMVFSTGSILIAGIRSEEDVDRAFSIIYPLAKLYAV